MLFIYILSRLYILLILTLTPHMFLSTGHMVHFNALYAPSVHQTRTHGAPGRWRKYIKAWRRVGRFREAEKEAEEDGSGLNSATP